MKTVIKNIKDIVVSLVSTPESHDLKILDQLEKMDSQDILMHFYSWMHNMTNVTDRVKTDNLNILSLNTATFSLIHPENIKIGIIKTPIGTTEITAAEITDKFSGENVDLIINLNLNKEDLSFHEQDNLLVINKNWLASIIIEKNLPFFAQLGGRAYYNRNLLETA